MKKINKYAGVSAFFATIIAGISFDCYISYQSSTLVKFILYTIIYFVVFFIINYLMNMFNKNK